MKRSGYHLPLDATEPRLEPMLNDKAQGPGERHGGAPLPCAGESALWCLRGFGVGASDAGVGGVEGLWGAQCAGLACIGWDC